MPELPEVETLRRTLAPELVDRSIEDVLLGSFTGVIGDVLPAQFRAGIIGQRITNLDRRGKYLIMKLSDDTAVVVHLRMTGQFLLRERADPAIRFEHLTLRLDNGRDLRFADQRKFGRVLHVRPDYATQLDQRLGPEPLAPTFTAEILTSRLASRPGKIKNVLLDQRLVAGLGNIYVDEALFRAGLHPLREARSLSVQEVARLHRAIRGVLRQALTNRGTTFSSYRDANGRQGGNQRYLSVYGRGAHGAPCDRCGGPLERLVVGGRGTHVCPVCQPVATGEDPPGATKRSTPVK